MPSHSLVHQVPTIGAGGNVHLHSLPPMSYDISSDSAWLKMAWGKIDTLAANHEDASA